MKFVVTCSRCGIDHDMPEDTVGKKLRCKECGNTFRVQHGVTQPSSPAHKPFYTFTVLPNTSKPIGQMVDRPRRQKQTYSPPANAHPLTGPKKSEPLFPWNQLDDGEKILASMGFAFMIFGAFGLVFPLLASADPSLRGVSRVIAILGVCIALVGATSLAGAFRRFPGWAAGLGGLGGIISIFVFFLVIIPLTKKTPRPYKPLVQNEQTADSQSPNANDANPAANGKASDDSETAEAEEENKPATRHPYEAPKSTTEFVIPKSDLPRNDKEENGEAEDDQNRPPSSRSGAATQPGSVLDNSNRNSRKPPSDDTVQNPPPSAGPDVPPDTPGIIPNTIPKPDQEEQNTYVELPETKVKGNDGMVHMDRNELRKAEQAFRDLFQQPGWQATEPGSNVYAAAEPSIDRKYQLTLEAQALTTVLKSLFGSRVASIIPNENVTPFAGSNGRTQTILVHPDKVPVVGMRFATDTWRGNERIALINPVFNRNVGDVDVLARDGFAVAGMEVNASNCVDGFRVIFMKIDGDRFDPSDRYTSQWFGVAGNDGNTVVLGGNGNPVYGLFLKHGLVLDGIALITEP